MSIDHRSQSVGGPIGVGFFLTEPNQFMPFLAEAIQDELAFFSHSTDGSVTYLSKSAENVLRIPPQRAVGMQLQELLSNNPCNDAFRMLAVNSSLPVTATSGTCEFLGSDADAAPVKLRYWRIPVQTQSGPIGFTGIFQRLDGTSLPNSVPAEEAKEIMSRVESLTPVEFQVIELVVDGHMNKESAALLHVAVRTIESRRSRAMSKMKTSGLSDLVQTWVLVRQLIATNTYERLRKFDEVLSQTPSKEEVLLTPLM